MRSGPAIAAITLNRRGGGVAAVSRLLHQVVSERWGGGTCSRRTSRSTPMARRRSRPALRRRRQFWCATDVAAGERALRLDAVHAPLGRPSAEAHSIARSAGRYAVPARHRAPGGPLSTASEAGRALGGATVLLANSAYTSARVVAAAHAWVRPPEICPLTLPPAECDADSTRVAPPHIWGPHAVLLVGRLAAAEQYKGHDQLIDAWPGVLSEVPDARLVFVGDGDDVPRLRAKAQALGVGSSLVTTGFLEDRALRLAYRDAAVFAMPSRNEGFGIVYLEAMAAGLPCIGSTEDAAGEIIEDGTSGPPGRTEQPGRVGPPTCRLVEGSGAASRVGRPWTRPSGAALFVFAVPRPGGHGAVGRIRRSRTDAARDESRLSVVMLSGPLIAIQRPRRRVGTTPCACSTSFRPSRCGMGDRARPSSACAGP